MYEALFCIVPLVSCHGFLTKSYCMKLSVFEHLESKNRENKSWKFSARNFLWYVVESTHLTKYRRGSFIFYVIWDFDKCAYCISLSFYFTFKVLFSGNIKSIKIKTWLKAISDLYCLLEKWLILGNSLTSSCHC